MPIVENLSNEEYHGKTDHVSNSMLTKIHESPYVLHYSLTHEQYSTTSQKAGSIMHALVLQPEVFDDEFIVTPDKYKNHGNSQAGKDERADFEIAANGKEQVTMGEYRKAEYMKNSIQGHEIAQKLLSTAGRPELSIFGIDPETGVKIKVRPDWLTENWIVDLKSARDASPVDFVKSVVNYRYHVQAAFYLDFIRQEVDPDIKGFAFIVVQNSAPWSVGVYTLDEDALELGRQTYRQDLDLYAICLQDDHWPNLGWDWTKERYQVQTLSLPGWAYK